MKIKMISRGGHVEVYDETGTFLFSADTFSEAIQDLEQMEAETRAG